MIPMNALFTLFMREDLKHYAVMTNEWTTLPNTPTMVHKST